MASLVAGCRAQRGVVRFSLSFRKIALFLSPLPSAGHVLWTIITYNTG